MPAAPPLAETTLRVFLAQLQYKDVFQALSKAHPSLVHWIQQYPPDAWPIHQSGLKRAEMLHFARDPTDSRLHAVNTAVNLLWDAITVSPGDCPICHEGTHFFLFSCEQQAVVCQCDWCDWNKPTTLQHTGEDTLCKDCSDCHYTPLFAATITGYLRREELC